MSEMLTEIIIEDRLMDNFKKLPSLFANIYVLIVFFSYTA